MTRTGTPRPRDAQATRTALLRTATELFSAHGYDRTTLRDIAEGAGVDAALVARYFGNKMNLYVATVEQEPAEPTPLDSPEDVVRYLLGLIRRTDGRGPGPLMQALARSDSAPEIRDIARDRLTRVLVEPLTRLLKRQGAPDPRLRAETAVAAIVGVLVVRGTESLPAVGKAADARLAATLGAMVRGLLDRDREAR